MALLGVAEMSDLSPQNAPKRTLQFTRASAMPQRSDGMRQALGKDVMRLFAPCPHTVACGFRGRIGADGDAR